MQGLHKLWDAAREGDAAAVRSMIRQHSIPADSVHHMLGSHLVLDIAEVQSASQERDGKLRDVLRVLRDAGWTLDVQDSSQRNALHHLAKATGAVAARVTGIVEMLKKQPARLHSMLATVDESGEMPEELFSDWIAADRDLARHLRDARLTAEHACTGTKAKGAASAVAVRVAGGRQGAAGQSPIHQFLGNLLGSVINREVRTTSDPVRRGWPCVRFV